MGFFSRRRIEKRVEQFRAAQPKVVISDTEKMLAERESLSEMGSRNI